MFMKKHERYIERNDLKGATHLEITVYYSLGGSNYLRGGKTPRGYYLSVTPVTKGDGSISYVMFSGQSRFLFETQRFTTKQLERAVEMSKKFEDELIAAVVEKNKAA